jgi:hypothetical protein
MNAIHLEICEARDKVALLENRQQQLVAETRNAEAANMLDDIEAARRMLETLEFNAEERPGSHYAHIF